MSRWGQVSVGAKTNEIPMLAGLLTVLDITDAVVTADATHSQREATQTNRDRGGHYIPTVKGNQPNLRTRVKSCRGKPPWQSPVNTAMQRADREFPHRSGLRDRPFAAK